MNESKDKQYQRLIDARNYHYDNLNKWLMTFYVILGALFVAFYKMYPSNMAIIVAVLGYVVSVGALLSCKGYFYWEVDWIMLIHHFEKVNFKKKDDRVYSVFGNVKTNNSFCCPITGASVSTTKVALAITTIVAVVWGTISFYLFYKLLGKWGINIPDQIQVVIWSFIISCILTFVLMLTSERYLKSDMQNLTDLGLTKENMAEPQAEEENE